MKKKPKKKAVKRMRISEDMITAVHNRIQLLDITERELLIQSALKKQAVVESCVVALKDHENCEEQVLIQAFTMAAVFFNIVEAVNLSLPEITHEEIEGEQKRFAIFMKRLIQGEKDVLESYTKASLEPALLDYCIEMLHEEDAFKQDGGVKLAMLLLPLCEVISKKIVSLKVK